MRILFIAMVNSIHTARWINQISEQGWEIHLFTSTDDSSIHRQLMNTIIHGITLRPPDIERRTRLPGALKWPFPFGHHYANQMLIMIKNSERIQPYLPSQYRRLSRVIEKIKPDIIHSLEIQHAGYLTLEAKKHIGGDFPKWIITNWGSDIYLFGRLIEHIDRIREVLAECDYYGCECHRDVELARAFGFQGKVLPVLPNAGGYDLEWVKQFRQPGRTSARRLILLKGYQHWAGRALFGLRALELCADVIKGYRIVVYRAKEDVKVAAELLAHKTKIPIDIIPRCSHEEMLRLHGQARISIGLSISDAVSTSFLEAIVMGSFPIQSCTGCADEWIRDEETGLLVPPEDPEQIALAIRHALTDDKLIDFATSINDRLVAEKLEYKKIKSQVIEMYKQVYSSTYSEKENKAL